MITFLIGSCITMFSLSIIIGSLINSNNGCTLDDNSYDYYNLALFYGNNKFTIHGLWPARVVSFNTYPCFCPKNIIENSEDISIVDLKNLKNLANLYWSPEEQKHEYEKHGSCTNMSEFDYIFKTISLYSLYKPSIILKQNRSYEYSELVNLLCRNIGLGLGLGLCLEENVYDCITLGCHSHENRQYLSEVGLCLSKQFQFRKCGLMFNKDEIDNCDRSMDIYV